MKKISFRPPSRKPVIDNRSRATPGTRRRGFTLIEVLIAVSIVAVLSVIGIVSFSSVNARSRDTKRISDLEQVRSALEMYRSDKGSYPAGTGSFSTLDSLNSTLVTTYLPTIPTDPKSTVASPIEYYYSPVGASAPYYSYCLCGEVEVPSIVKNDCTAIGVDTSGVSANCNYFVRNP